MTTDDHPATAETPETIAERIVASAIRTDGWPLSTIPMRAEVAAVIRAERASTAALVAAAREEERERAASIALAQPFYPDTITGMRQQWVKEQIAAAVLAAPPGDGTERRDAKGRE